jgi:O-antigen ligase
VNPILGLGPANYHFYTPLFSIMGYYIEFNSHNNYVDVVAQAGLLGLAFFLWFFGEIGWLGWKLRKVVPQGFEYAFVIGCLGGLGGSLVAGMLGDWVIPFIYNIGLRGMRASILAFIFFAGLVVLEKRYLNQPQGESE